MNVINWDQVYGQSDTSDWGESGPEWKTWDKDYGSFSSPPKNTAEHLVEPDAGIVNFYQTKVGHSEEREIFSEFYCRTLLWHMLTALKFVRLHRWFLYRNLFFFVF